MTNSPDFWSILRSIMAVQEATAAVFEIVENVTVGVPSAITADNYESAVLLLNDFASAASVGSLHEQKGDKATRRKSGKNAKPQYVISSVILFRLTRNNRDNQVVIRGSKAIGIIYQLTSRVPNLIKQSHLERTEGRSESNSCFYATLTLAQRGPRTGRQYSTL
jgi:golgi-specific brefeldin A-resistance guanine nucleotide exchange factor 1